MSGRHCSVFLLLLLLLGSVCSAQESEQRTYYMLQVGVYRELASADAIVERLKKANFGYYQREKYTTAGGKIRYRVRIGPFASRDQAAEASDMLGELGVEPLLLERQGTPPATVAPPQHRIVGIPPTTARAAPVPQPPTVASPTPAQPGQMQQQNRQPQQQTGQAAATPTPAGQAPQQAGQIQQPGAQGQQPQQATQSQPQRQPAQSPAQTRPGAAQKVGQAPSAKPQEKAPEVQAIAELGGVLTPKGSLALEPQFEYSNSQVNRATFQGIALESFILLGNFNLEDADRDITSASLTGRYGITNRLELELKVPYIARDDNFTATVVEVETGAEPAQATESSLQGKGLGDVEVALHYQLNSGQNGWPFLVGNLRYKADTGEGPFEVERDADGNETELAIGSGFEAVEPSLTVLYPSDPGMFFANVGYLFALQEKVNKTFAEQTVSQFSAGDTVRVNFGMAYAMNDRASYTLGFKQDFIKKSEVVINGVKIPSSDLKVGAFLLGFALQSGDNTSINLNLEFGVTADAPDVRVSLRLPYSF